jgi:hypothetical protein
VVAHDVTAGEAVRHRMEAQLGRVATPAIVIGQRVFWGFEDNKRDIAELLGVGIEADEHEPAPAPDAASDPRAPS